MIPRTTERALDVGAATSAGHARNLLVHLRLPFQLTLAPFMLWGVALSGARVSAKLVLAFVVLQVCFYGGTTAFNSHYDRDEGPVGGLSAPPPAGPWLLPGSLLLQVIGLALAALVDARFFAVCLLYAVLGILYSHPSVRWKARPFASWAVVMFGQGALGVLAGVVATAGTTVTPEVTAGLVGAAMLVGALYPLTQLFQTEEDAARGDRTAAMVLGPRGTCIAAVTLAVLGSAAMAASASLGGRPAEAALLVTAWVPLSVGAVWACATAAPKTVFRRVTVVQLAAGAGFALYTIVRIVAQLRA